MPRTACAPASCPRRRGRPRRVAQRPFPSMTMATCSPSSAPLSCEVLGIIKCEGKKISAVANGADQRFHVVDITFERLTALRGQAELRLRHSSLEPFLAHHVARVLELPGVHAQV